MTPAQRRCLEAIRDGRVTYLSTVRWAPYSCVRSDVVDRVFAAGLASMGPWCSLRECRVVLTDAGQKALR